MPRSSQPDTRSEAAKADAQRHAAWLEAVAQRQDRAAFADLFNHFGPRVKAYLMRLGADDAMAEEVAQDVMVTVWRKAALFDRSKSSAATWLFRIARNRRIDVLRRKRTINVDTETMVIEDENLPDPNETLDEEKRQKRIRQALAELPEQQLQLVELAFFTELSHSQIAEETGLPLGTVKSRIRLAFGRLRRLLEDDDQVDAPSS
ncbi:MAG: sigma-70 family RNA polymerase sigma factor [Rhizobiales bacterium]|nr:sigma-70 family RNA polymerase sigma factor [Hyphomicrobiales bacterium]MBO6699992.1 sigma-70 family RNA polymerase sigma factor [Hyphomicrobiales bacterium]MBO6737843.1 sigma-70 family RNA polymerase sigma factor [Hyphomicrobiales bacterium]MBO6913100.1 sigma-70 family RNA polymerase sigma factor [Hyphomicrobiales bacterium]MBO6957080.1 sigma-70 family RNA polymerase sigma factor [Hyphomicrobiales bacterium]